MAAVPNLPAAIVDRSADDNSTIQHEPNDPTAVTTNGATANGFHPGLHLSDHPVDHSRPLKVVVIGAGFSGIYFGIRIPQRLRNVELVIYDKNDGVGGTWFENKYPGCACDFSFNPNPHWSALYAPAPEIQAYLAETVKKYSVDRFIKLSHKVEQCRYDDISAQWNMRVRNLLSNEVFEENSDIVINARGGLNEANWPDIQGFHDFQGEVMHSAKWNDSYDFRNRKVGVIGSGSSSIQIVPNLQRIKGIHLSCFVRNKTWISPPFGQEVWDSMGIKDLKFSEASKAKFTSNPEAYLQFRLSIEEGGNAVHAFTIRGTSTQAGAREMFSESMKKRLETKPEIFEALLPNFSPGCRRLTPGIGYLEALCESNVDFITSGITGIESIGIRTSNGVLHEIDVLVCATGFKAGAPPPFPVVGRHGETMTEHWRRYPRTYLSLATDNFPNYFMMLGPNSAIGSGSLTMMIESTADYIIRCVRKIQKENIKSMEVKKERVDDFVEVAQAYFKKTVFTDDCRSWYKNAHGEITGLWPGSTQACIEVMRSPRWEDWNYEALPLEAGKHQEKPNMLAFIGNGWTENQLANKHLAYYLYPEFVDVPAAPLPEEGGEYESRPFSH